MRFLSTAFKAVTGSFLAWLGGIDPLIQAWFFMMFLDIALGFVVGFKERNISSDICFKGLVKKKIAMMFLVFGGMILDNAWHAQFTAGGHVITLASAIAGSFVIHEFTSLAEHAARLGAPIPEIIKDALVKLGRKLETPIKMRPLESEELISHDTRFGR